MVDSSEIEALETQLDALENSVVATTQVAQSFQSGLSGMQDSLALTERTVDGVSRSLSNKLGNAFTDLVFEGAKLSDVLSNVAQSMIQSTFNQAVQPLTSGITDLISGGISNAIGAVLPFEKGGVFSSGRVTPFAKGGIVSSPTTFPMRGGTGLMGEAGPEAIIPLARGSDGALGVRGGSASNVTVNMNITSPDASSFTRSRAQVAAGISRAIQRGRRNF
ncbi:tail protein [Amylibacter marinus]|uniref:Tail protein n=1 Tax=Amylibacter marinus TaxID=1475483 RepID=A0ABQ5VRU6_9RHOB|nr:phage tail tape measure protein [Amylibacter marinus]GLQ34059.1 tail protein [Amylibacter marinus]